MQRFNVFYIAIVLIGILLFTLFRPSTHGDLSFYGFAESNETEINYNYPVVVDHILVTQGQAVKKGDTLIKISRRKSKERLEDQSFRMAELKAEEALWKQKKESELAELSLTKQTKLEEADTKIKQVEKELAFKKSLAEGLNSVSPNNSAYQPLEEKLAELKSERARTEEAYNLRLQALRKELRLGNSPFQEQLNRLKAEQEFEASQKVQHIAVIAPTDGLIGNISCKEEEHIPSYTTLLSFYEPHSGIIKGYVHEDLTLQVNLGDKFEAASLKDENMVYPGKVIGLGSRIVEIPTRLRKIPEVKNYGREVLVEIDKDNRFLQKEKVSLRFISGKDQ